MGGLILGIPVWALCAIAAAFLAIGELQIDGATTLFLMSNRRHTWLF
jgi:hypothetical protein